MRKDTLFILVLFFSLVARCDERDVLLNLLYEHDSQQVVKTLRTENPSLLMFLFLQTGHFKDLKGLALTEVDSNPLNLKNQLMLLSAEKGLGDAVGIKQTCSKILAQHPDNVNVALECSAALEAFDSDGSKKVIDDFMAKDSSDGKVISRRIQQYMADGDYDLAKSDLLKVLKTGPVTFMTYLSLGVVYRKIGDLTSSLKNLNQARVMNLDSYLPPLEEARTYETMGEWKKSLSFYSRALALAGNSPQKAEVYLSLGKHFMRRGDFGLAKKNFLSALDAAPKYKDAAYNLFKNFLLQNDKSGASVAMVDYMKKNPEQAWVKEAYERLAGTRSVASVDNSENMRMVTVQDGETLSSISLREFGSRVYWGRLVQLNKDAIANPNRIPAGTKLIVCAGAGCKK